MVNKYEEEILPFDDYFDDEDDYCPECGELMKTTVEKHPYGSTTATEYLRYCPNCD